MNFCKYNALSQTPLLRTQRLKRRQGPVILVVNHVTNFNVFPMQFARQRPIFFMGKAELFKNPLTDLFLRNLSDFPVNRGEKDEWATRRAAKVLKHGQILGMFPEGKRLKGLALDANCPRAEGSCRVDQFFKRFLTGHASGLQDFHR